MYRLIIVYLDKINVTRCTGFSERRSGGWLGILKKEGFIDDEEAHWLNTFVQYGPSALAFEQSGGSPALQPEQQAALKAAVEGTPGQVGVPLANWTWRGVQQFLRDRFALELSRSSCLRWLHRLNFT